MGRTTYDKLQDFVEKIKHNKTIGYMTLQKFVKLHIGSDPRTVENAIRTMIETDMLKDIGDCQFEICQTKTT